MKSLKMHWKKVVSGVLVAVACYLAGNTDMKGLVSKVFQAVDITTSQPSCG